MSDKVVQFGPFTPQEVDRLARELQLKNIPFELAKDDRTEKDFRRNDFANLVNQVEFRTEQYLAQEFYVTLARKDVNRVAKLLADLGFPTELPEATEELNTPESEDRFVRAKAEKKNFDKRLLVWLLIIGFLCLYVLLYAVKSNPF